MPLASALLPLGRERVVSPAEHPPAPVPPLTTSPLLSHSSAPLPSCPTPQHLSPPVPPLLAPSAALPAQGSLSPFPFGSDFTFPTGTGRSLPLPTSPPGFSVRSSGVAGGCSPGVLLAVRLSCRQSLPSVRSPRAPAGSSRRTRLSQSQERYAPSPGHPPLPRAASDAGAEPEFLGSFGKMLIIYGDFSPCPAAALRGPRTLNKNIVYFRADLIYSGSGVASTG